MTSRYTTARNAWMPHPTRGNVEVVLRRPSVWSDQPYSSHVATVADSLPGLAGHFYNDSTRYWLLADMNPAIECPDDLEYGTVVHVPIIQS